MEEKYKHKIITIPNVLSFFRLLLIPVIVWLYIVKKDTIWTMAMLALSGITDIVDGIQDCAKGRITHCGALHHRHAEDIQKDALSAHRCVFGCPCGISHAGNQRNKN